MAFCRLASTAEISIEADPGTFDIQLLKEFMSLGINRFSIGVQGFDEVCSHVLLNGCRNIHAQKPSGIQDLKEAVPSTTKPSSTLTNSNFCFSLCIQTTLLVIWMLVQFSNEEGVQPDAIIQRALFSYAMWISHA